MPNYPFTTPSDYSYATSLIEISGGKASLMAVLNSTKTNWMVVSFS